MIGIVGSVVPVNDEAVVELMLALHRGLRQGQRMAEALHDACTFLAASGSPVALASAWSFIAFGPG